MIISLLGGGGIFSGGLLFCSQYCNIIIQFTCSICDMFGFIFVWNDIGTYKNILRIIFLDWLFQHKMKVMSTM